ncbi:MAG: DNA adenine methylase [Pseudomonadota bacterium]
MGRLVSDGTLPYKRYLASPLRYAGGKSLAVGLILEHLPAGISRLVSPFIGGGAVELACAKELELPVIGYDLFDLLANYWHVQLNDAEVLAEMLAGWNPDKATYQQVKQRLGDHWRGTCLIDDRLELAAHYWFNHNLSYGPGFLGWMSKIYEEPKRYHRLVEKLRCFHCPQLDVKQGSFEDTIPRHRDAFLYCDPPYYLDGDSKMFRGIYPQRNFPIHHNGFDHEALRDLLTSHQGGFILSYNDCTAVREWYRDYEIQEVTWQYTLGQGETRIGKNRQENDSEHHVKRSHELLIIGW